MVVVAGAKTKIVEVEPSCAVSVWRTFLHGIGPSSVSLWYPEAVFIHCAIKVFVVKGCLIRTA